MEIELTDTIVAISTPPGDNGIGIIRLSGPHAIDIADAVFVSKSGITPSRAKSHSIHYGYIEDSGRRVDEVLLTVMRSPKTYTRQDIVEINCHGGIVVTKEVFDLLLAKGARIAEPGEFTKIAFLNGRIDLTQAEAVLDIISSRTSAAMRLAQRQLAGGLSDQIKGLRRSLMEVIAEIEAEINFPEEEIGLAVPAHTIDPLKAVGSGLRGLLDDSDKGLILRDGVTTVICGRPNVGKSTLMNSLLKQRRVIVTPVPGTTRDAIEEIINIDGIPLKIVDTAGILHAEDEPSKEGVAKSLHYMEIADLILLVLDSSDLLGQDDLDIIDMVKDRKAVVVINKTDLPEVLHVEEVKKHLHDKRILKISAKENKGLDELKKAIHEILWRGEVVSDSMLVSNARHIGVIRKALTLIESSVAALEQSRPLEVLAIDIKDAVEILGTVTGETFTEDLLDTIFGRFCIGK